jgi:hypothetical protein
MDIIFVETELFKTSIVELFGIIYWLEEGLLVRGRIIFGVADN